MTIETKNVVLGVVAGAAAVASGAAAASAADVAPMVDDWSGFYAGASVGYGFGESGVWDTDYDISGGVVGGVHVGFNYQTGSGIILGVEAAYSIGSRQLDYDDDQNYDYSISPIFDLKARVGYALDSFMIYGFGGFSSMPFNHGYNTEYQNYGFNLGLGAEMMVTDNISLGAEYIYRKTTDSYDYDRPSYNAGTDTTLNEFVLRASYHFN